MAETMTELFDIEWRETSFVPAGDNPPARIVMWKNEPDLTDEEIEEVLLEVSGPEPGDGPLAKFKARVASLFGKAHEGPGGLVTATFDDHMKSRMREQIHKELFTYLGALEESLAAGLFDEGGGAMEQTVDEFASAIKEAIPLWSQGKTSLAKEDLETEPERRAEMPTTMQKANALARRKIAAEPERFGKMSPTAALAAARSEVWNENPALAEQQRRAPAPPVVERPAVVHKAAQPFSKIDQAAREELPDLYRRSPSRARAEVSKLRPDLQAAYHGAHGAK